MRRSIASTIESLVENQVYERIQYLEKTASLEEINTAKQKMRNTMASTVQRVRRKYPGRVYRTHVFHDFRTNSQIGIVAQVRREEDEL